MSDNIFINENIKLTRIEITTLTENIISYNYIPFDTLKRFNKYLMKYKKMNTCYGEITECTIKIIVIDENNMNFNELYQLVNNSFYEPKINFDKIYQNIDDPQTVTFENNFQDALSEIIAETERLKQLTNNIEVTEMLSDDDISDNGEKGEIVNEEMFDTEINI